MAEVTSELPNPRSDQHSWSEWLDGQTWRLTRGVDYHADERVLADLAYNAARRRGIKVRVRYSRRGGVVTVQACNRDGSAIGNQ